MDSVFLAFTVLFKPTKDSYSVLKSYKSHLFTLLTRFSSTIDNKLIIYICSNNYL